MGEELAVKSVVGRNYQYNSFRIFPADPRVHLYFDHGLKGQVHFFGLMGPPIFDYGNGKIRKLCVRI